MALDTVFSSNKKGGLTDVELQFLKMPGCSKREVFSIRRDAQEKAKAIIALHCAARDCRENEDPDVFPVENPVTEKITEHPMFHDLDLGLQTWMLVYLLDRKFMSKYGNHKIHSLFDISDREFEQHYPSVTSLLERKNGKCKNSAA